MRPSPVRILMFVENLFPADPRVRNECEALCAAGYRITVVCLRKRGEPFAEIVQGIQVYRLASLSLFKKTPGPGRSSLQRGFLKVASVVGYLGEYLYFTTACFCMSVYIALKRGFDVIHAHNPPDTLFLVAALYKPFGKKFIFDHHDLSPELYQSRYGVNNNLLTRTLRLMEKCSLKLANVTIATNESYKEIQIQRGASLAGRTFIVSSWAAVIRWPICARWRLNCVWSISSNLPDTSRRRIYSAIWRRPTFAWTPTRPAH